MDKHEKPQANIHLRSTSTDTKDSVEALRRTRALRNKCEGLQVDTTLSLAYPLAKKNSQLGPLVELQLSQY